MSLSVVGLQLSSLFSFLSFSLNVASIAVIVSVGNVLHHRDLHHHRCHRHQSSSPPIPTTTTTTMVKTEPGSSLSSHALSVVVCLSPFYRPPCQHHHFQERQDFLIILNLFPDTRRGRSTRTSAMCASVSTLTQSSPSTTRPRSTSIKVN